MRVFTENELTPTVRAGRGVPQQIAERPVRADDRATALGNQDTQRLLAPGRALAVSEPGDPSELEADRLSSELVDHERPVVPTTIQRQPDGDDASYPREADHASSTGVAAFLNTSGHPLDRASHMLFEPRLGRDLARVRIHTGPDASRAAVALNAHAFTVGDDIVFGEGRYAPETSAGRRLLAHELVHTVQQHRPTAIQRQHAEEGELRVFHYHGMARSFELFINSTPAPYTLTMCAMTDDIIGHAWISIMAADGSARTIGFWPGNIGGPITLDNWLFPVYMPGKLLSEDPHAGDKSHSFSTRVSRNEITKALDVIADFDKRLYSILFFNCANFVAQVWRAVTGTSIDPYLGSMGDDVIWVPSLIGAAADERKRLEATKGAVLRRSQ